MEQEKKDKSFVVKDRRKFTEDGESRTEDAEVTEAGIKTEAKEEAAGTDRAEDGKLSEDMLLPEMNFANFVISLSTTAMFHFGDFPDPVTKKAEKNIAAAKQAIDILGMLKEKTVGNLSADEKGILDAILFELRMRYVKEKG
jgi:hypothetical protein